MPWQSSSRRFTISWQCKQARWPQQRKQAYRHHHKAAPTCATALAAQALELHFSVPYQTYFGQSLCVLGSDAALGTWDETAPVPMEWSEGHVWRATVKTETNSVEYKYVVRESDGQISRWKPGGNFAVRMQPDFTGAVHVYDEWDGTVHDVDAPPDSTAAAPEWDDAAQQQPAVESYDSMLQAALNSAFSDLEDVLTESRTLAEEVAADDPQMLLNDQKLAAAHERAVSLSRAISAGAPPPAYILKEMEDRRQSASESNSE